MKHKLSQHQAPVYDNLFSSPPAPTTHPSPQPQLKPMPVYHVEKINKMKFKVYKQGAGRQQMERVPVTDLSFQIKLKGEEEVGLAVRPRLEEILSEYRKLNLSGRNSRAKTFEKKHSGGEFNVRLMASTVNRFARSPSHRK